MEHWAKFFFCKNLPRNMFKTFLDTFGDDFGHFWNFDVFQTFLKFFEVSSLHGKLGKSFQKYRPKTCSKHIWTILGSILGIFVILRIFRLFSKLRSLEPPWNTGQKFLLEKFAAKHARSKHIWIRLEMIFGYFWNFENFLIFMKIFEVSSLHGTLGKKFFEKFAPKHVQNTFGHFW